MKSKGDDMFSTKDNADGLNRKQCVRFLSEGIPERDIKDAVAYLSLRGSGCPRKDAIHFAAKSNCRIDTTKKIDGPTDFRFLKHLNPPPQLVEEGWLYGQPDYQFNSCIPSRYESISGENQNDERMEQNFRAEESEMRKEYSAMIARMKAYVNQINSKYADLKNPTGILESVRRISKEVKAQISKRHCFTLKNLRFYEIAEQILEHKNEIQKTEHAEQNLIDLLNIFKTYENDPELNSMKIFKPGDEDDDDPDFFFEESAISSARRLGLSKEAGGSSSNNQPSMNAKNESLDPFVDQSTGRMGRRAMRLIEGRIRYAPQLSSLESVAMLLEEFEKGESQQSVGQQGRFSRGDDEILKARQEQMMAVLQAVRKENDSGLDSQFNSQKYVFAKDFKPKESLEKEKREKQELIQFIIERYKQKDRYNQNTQDQHDIITMKEHQKRYNDNFSKKIMSLREIRSKGSTVSQENKISQSLTQPQMIIHMKATKQNEPVRLMSSQSVLRRSLDSNPATSLQKKQQDSTIRLDSRLTNRSVQFQQQNQPVHSKVSQSSILSSHQLYAPPSKRIISHNAAESFQSTMETKSSILSTDRVSKSRESIWKKPSQLSSTYFSSSRRTDPTRAGSQKSIRSLHKETDSAWFHKNNQTNSFEKFGNQSEQNFVKIQQEPLNQQPFTNTQFTQKFRSQQYLTRNPIKQNSFLLKSNQKMIRDNKRVKHSSIIDIFPKLSNSSNTFTQ